MGFLSLSRLLFDELIYGIFFKDQKIFFIFITFNKNYIVEILLKEHEAVCF